MSDLWVSFELSLDIIQEVIMCDSVWVWSGEHGIELITLYQLYLMVLIIINRLELHILISLKHIISLLLPRKILTMGKNYF